MNEQEQPTRSRRFTSMAAIALLLAVLAFSITIGALQGSPASAQVDTGGSETVEVSHHQCWEDTLADTESGKEELRAIRDAFTDCGGPLSATASAFGWDD